MPDINVRSFQTGESRIASQHVQQLPQNSQPNHLKCIESDSSAQSEKSMNLDKRNTISIEYFNYQGSAAYSVVCYKHVVVLHEEHLRLTSNYMLRY